MKLVALKDVCRITNGGTPRSGVESFWHGDVSWLTPAEMGKRLTPYIEQTARTISQEGLENSSAKLVPPSSVILSTRAPIGHLAINETPMAFNQGCRGLTPGDKLDTKYLYYFLYFSRDALDGLGTGTTFKELSSSSLANFLIPILPLDEQRRIVTVLDNAFAGIAAATANARKKLANARELFESYAHSTFADLVATEPAASLKELTELITKGSSPKWQGIAYVDAPGVLFVTSENVGSYELKLDRPKYVELEFNRKDRKSILQNGDVLTNIVGASIGRTAIYAIDELANINQAVCLIRCKNDVLSNRYLTHLLNCPQFLEILHSNEVNSARANLSLGFFSHLEIPCPSLPVQTAVADKLDGFRDVVTELIELQNRKLAALAELKQTLLQKAFAGELTPAVAAANISVANDNLATPEGTARIIAFAHRRHQLQSHQQTYGRVKAQKSLHLVESIGGIDLGRQPMKDAAGPNDFPHMLRAEEWAEARGFFKFVPRANGNGYDFKKLANYDALWADAVAATKPVAAALEKAIDPIVPMVSLDAEVFATVHAAWNNLIHDGAAITEDTIVKAARDDWHSAKLKIPEHKFRDAIRTIKAKNMDPDGSAKYVGGQVKLI